MTQLAELAKPFRSADVHKNPSGGGEYVKHSTVVEKLLYTVGNFDFRVVEIIRGHVPGTPPNPNGNSKRAKEGTPDLHDAVVGCLAELTLEIDGRTTIIVEVGDCEQPHNWPHDGARLKDAASDAIKRAAMRCGVGLSLWSQDSYRLHEALKDAPSPQGAPAPPSTPPVGVGPDTLPAGIEASGAGGDDEAPTGQDPAGSDPVAASPPETLSNTAENNTRKHPRSAGGADGVVREMELAPTGDPDQSGSPLTSARRRLDSAKGHK